MRKPHYTIRIRDDEGKWHPHGNVRHLHGDQWQVTLKATEEFKNIAEGAPVDSWIQFVAKPHRHRGSGRTL